MGSCQRDSEPKKGLKFQVSTQTTQILGVERRSYSPLNAIHGFSGLLYEQNTLIVEVFSQNVLDMPIGRIDHFNFCTLVSNQH